MLETRSFYLRGLLLGAALLWLAACGGRQQGLSEADRAVFQDKRANPYTFNRSVANTLLRTNQPMEASRVIRRMLNLQPESVEAHCMMARAYLDMRQYDAAERTLLAALKEDPKYAPGHALLGVLLDTLGRHQEARSRHRQSIELAPKQAAYHNNLGFSFYLDGRYHDAVKAYRAALVNDLAEHRVHNNLAFAYAKLGNLTKAQEHFQLAGPPAQASNNLGFVHERRGDDEAAYSYYTLALQQDPLLIPARNNLERVCERLGRPLPEVAQVAAETVPLQRDADAITLDEFPKPSSANPAPSSSQAAPKEAAP